MIDQVLGIAEDVVGLLQRIPDRDPLMIAGRLRRRARRARDRQDFWEQAARRVKGRRAKRRWRYAANARDLAATLDDRAQRATNKAT